MIRIFHAVIIGTCTVGVLTGVGARKWLDKSGPSGEVVSGKSGLAGRNVKGGSSAFMDAGGPASSPHRKSSETVGSLLAVDASSDYGRLAGWLIDASEEDIAKYWEGYRNGPRTNDATDLIFLNWARLNPKGAIAAVAGTADEHYAWWAWSCHDPRASLDAAIVAGKDRINNVAWGIGEFHPQWFRDHFKDIPESGRNNAFQGMRKWTDDMNPAESIRFMKEHGIQVGEDTLRSLARSDPWEAERLLKEGSFADSQFDPAGRKEVILSTLARERPEEFARMMEKTPAGELKRDMEQAHFERMLEGGITAAMEYAKSANSPVIASERLSQIGMRYVREKPDEAFRIAAEALQRSGGQLGTETMIEYKGGSTSWGNDGSYTAELMQVLFSSDRERTMDLVAGLGNQSNSRTSSELFHAFTQQWASSDLKGFSDWAGKQTESFARENAVGMVSSQLAQRGAYEEAMEWALSTPARNQVPNVIFQWGISDPEQAQAWLESSDLSPQDKMRHAETLKHVKP